METFLAFHARKSERQPRVLGNALGVHQIDVARRVGHDEVTFAEERVLVLIVRDGLGDLSFEAVHGEIHFGDMNRGRVFLLAVKHDLFRRVFPFMLDEVTGLDKHAA